MTLQPNLRALTAWILYASLLFSALACSLHHGQAAAWQLNGLGGAFCSAEGNSGPTLEPGLDGQLSTLATVLPDCLLCGNLVVALLLFYLARWQRRHNHSLPWSWQARFPRQNWPPANPRAP